MYTIDTPLGMFREVNRWSNIISIWWPSWSLSCKLTHISKHFIVWAVKPQVLWFKYYYIVIRFIKDIIILVTKVLWHRGSEAMGLGLCCVVNAVVGKCLVTRYKQLNSNYTRNIDFYSLYFIFFVHLFTIEKFLRNHNLLILPIIKAIVKTSFGNYQIKMVYKELSIS